MGRAGFSGAHSCSCLQDAQQILRICPPAPQAAISTVFPNPKRRTVKYLNIMCYSPSALCHAWHGGELSVANTTTGKLSDCRTGGSALCPPVCPPRGPMSARAMPSTPGWGDTGEGWGWAWTGPASHQSSFLVADRLSGCCLKLLTCPCTVCQG